MYYDAVLFHAPQSFYKSDIVLWTLRKRFYNFCMGQFILYYIKPYSLLRKIFPAIYNMLSPYHERISVAVFTSMTMLISSSNSYSKLVMPIFWLPSVSHQLRIRRHWPKRGQCIKGEECSGQWRPPSPPPRDFLPQQRQIQSWVNASFPDDDLSMEVKILEVTNLL